MGDAEGGAEQPAGGLTETRDPQDGRGDGEQTGRILASGGREGKGEEGEEGEEGLKR